MLERGQREPQRRPGDAEALDQPQLGHPFAGRELTAQDQLAQTQHRPRHLTLCCLDRPTLTSLAPCPRMRRRGSLDPHARLHAKRTVEPLRTRILGVVLGTYCMQLCHALVSPASPNPGRVQNTILEEEEIGEDVPPRSARAAGPVVRPQPSACCCWPAAVAAAAVAAPAARARLRPHRRARPAAPARQARRRAPRRAGPSPGVAATRHADQDRHDRHQAARHGLHATSRTWKARTSRA